MAENIMCAPIAGCRTWYCQRCGYYGAHCAKGLLKPCGIPPGGYYHRGDLVNGNTHAASVKLGFVSDARYSLEYLDGHASLRVVFVAIGVPMRRRIPGVSTVVSNALSRCFSIAPYPVSTLCSSPAWSSGSLQGAASLSWQISCLLRHGGQERT